MYHLQTLVLGLFPFRLHAHRGRAVTHLMDDPIVPDAPALAAARDAGLPYFRGGIVEHGGAGQPIMEAVHLPAGELHSRLMLDSPMRDCMAAFTMQGEDLPQATNRIAWTPHPRMPKCPQASHSPHRHDAARRPLGLLAVMKGAHTRSVSPLPRVPPAVPIPRRPSFPSWAPRMGSTCVSVRPAQRTGRRQRAVTDSSVPTRRVVRRVTIVATTLRCQRW
jgi:hypothetical protein